VKSFAEPGGSVNPQRSGPDRVRSLRAAKGRECNEFDRDFSSRQAILETYLAPRSSAERMMVLHDANSRWTLGPDWNNLDWRYLLTWPLSIVRLTNLLCRTVCFLKIKADESVDVGF